MNNIKLSKDDWIVLTDCEETIYIGNVNQWIEDFMIMGITHETIHAVIKELEGGEVSSDFDNIFGYADPSILLQHEDDSEFDSLQRHRLERTFWKRR